MQMKCPWIERWRHSLVSIPITIGDALVVMEPVDLFASQMHVTNRQNKSSYHSIYCLVGVKTMSTWDIFRFFNGHIIISLNLQELIDQYVDCLAPALLQIPSQNRRKLMFFSDRRNLCHSVIPRLFRHGWEEIGPPSNVVNYATWPGSASRLMKRSKTDSKWINLNEHSYATTCDGC